jgi:hypothetical protein
MREFGSAAKEINVLAEITPPSSTLVADAAVTRWIHGNSIAWFERGHTRSAFYDLAGHLVAEDHRLPDLEIGHATFVKVVQIGSADSSGAQPDEYLVRTGFRGIAVFQPEIMCTVNDAGEHILKELGARI